MPTIRKKPQLAEESKMNMTPMIDVTFLLLIFFMLTTKFRLQEGYLKSYLPKDRGSTGSEPVRIENHRIVLRWGAEDKTLFAFANSVRNAYPRQVILDPDHGEISVPNWDAVLGDIEKRQQTYAQGGHSPDGKPLPIIIDFDSDVPYRFVVRAYDLCKQVAGNLDRPLDITFARPEIQEGS